MTRRAWAVALAAAAVIFAVAGTIVIAGSSEGPPDTTAVTGAATTALAEAPSTPQPTTLQPTATTVEPTSSARFEEADCRFSVTMEREVRCGYLVVPADRTDPASGEVRLHVAIFSSDDPSPEPDPVIYLEGGPGGDALETVPFSFEDRFGPYLADRDVVMFDQRGTGYSEPSLACPEARQLDFELLDDVLAPDEYVARQIEAVEACHDRLQGEGVDLSLFDSASSSADVADLGRALGYEQWNLYGISYGTRLALTVMRDHPDHVRSVILDSTYPPSVDALTGFPGNAERSFEELFDACAADNACAATYPDLASRFDALVTALDEEPLMVPVTDVFSGDPYEAALDGAGLIGLTFQSLYSAELIPLLPGLIAELEGRETATASSLLTNFLAQGEFLSLGALASVQCREEISFADPDEVEAAASTAPIGGRLAATSLNTGPPAFEMCQVWGAGQAAPLETRSVRSSIPTLVLAGGFDPITPPAWAAEAASTLRNATTVEFDPLSHGVSSGQGCPAQIATAFLDDPEATLDFSCAASIAPPQFVAAESGEVVMEPFDTVLLGVPLSGLAPQGWDEVAPGSFARLETPVDPTALVLQAGQGLTSAQLLGLVAGQLGFTLPDQPNDTHEGAGRSWPLYEVSIQGSPALVTATELGEYAAVGIIIAKPEELDALRGDVFLPALDAFEVG
jgi:pimeloyl-ACP methyl ester carboxylesterase